MARVLRCNGGSDHKASARNAGDPGFDPWFGKIPWRRKWQPTPVFLPGKSHGREDPGRLQSMGWQRIGHDWATSLSFLMCTIEEGGEASRRLRLSHTEFISSSIVFQIHLLLFLCVTWWIMGVEEKCLYMCPKSPHSPRYDCFQHLAESITEPAFTEQLECQREEQHKFTMPFG